MQKITSAQNPGFKNALKLHNSRGRKQQKRFVVFGIREIKRASTQPAFKMASLYLSTRSLEQDGTLRETTQEIVERTGCETYELDPLLFDKLSYGDRHDGIIAVIERPDVGPSIQSLDRLPVTDDGFIVVLESIETPGNLGAVIRSADGAGADAVIVANPLTDPFHPNCIRSSIGCVFSVPLAMASGRDIIDWLKKHGFKTYAAIVDAQQSLYAADLTGRCAIALGNEAKGLSADWQGSGLSGVSLPMLGIADSLNVSVTASIMIYEARRQRSS